MNIFLKIFYLVLFILLYNEGSFYTNSNLKNIEFVLFASPLNIFDQREYLFPLIYISSFLVLVLNLIKRNSFLFYLLNCLVLVLISMKFSFGKVSHTYHLWMICCFLMCFLDQSKPITQIRNLWVIRTMQGLLLSTYFISGCWKIIEMIKRPPLSIPKMGLEHIAYSSAEGNRPSDIVFQIMINYPIIITIGFILVLLFQLSCFYPIRSQRKYQLWALLCFLFHFSTGITMKIWYSHQMVLAIVILYIFEEIIRKKESSIHAQ